MVLETTRLFLKSPFEVTGTAVRNYYWENREFLKEFSPIREAEFYTEGFQSRQLEEQRLLWQAGTGFRFYICRKAAPEEVIGSLALNNVVRGAFHSCFLGYQLDAEHARQGYMTEAINRMVEFAFQELNLHRIEANIIPRNIPSRALAEKCSFQIEGLSPKYLKINGVWEDHVHYVIRNLDME